VTLVKIIQGGGTATPASFNLTLGGNSVTSSSTTPVDAGVAYVINESAVADYAFIGPITGHAQCPAALGGTITLGLAENAVCFITNVFDGKIDD
jgi:hypothetical protein